MHLLVFATVYTREFIELKTLLSNAFPVSLHNQEYPLTLNFQILSLHTFTRNTLCRWCALGGLKSMKVMDSSCSIFR